MLLTQRSRGLRAFSGHVAFPGGKAEPGETAWQTAYRETQEEIGLNALPPGVSLEKLTELPAFLARTLLAVRPCVAYLKGALDECGPSLALNAGECGAVFSVPLLDFWGGRTNKIKEYTKKKMVWTKWAGMRWPLRTFEYPIANSHEESWLASVSDLSSDEGAGGVRRVWGLTANILHELAGIAFGKDSDREIGEERVIEGLMANGHMKEERSQFEIKIINGDREVKFDEVL